MKAKTNENKKFRVGDRVRILIGRYSGKSGRIISLNSVLEAALVEFDGGRRENLRVSILRSEKK